MVRTLIAGMFLVASMAQAGPLPEHKGVSFYAITYCGSLAGVIWFTETEAFKVRLGQIRTQEMLDRIMAARKAAEESGTAYEVDVSSDAACPEV